MKITIELTKAEEIYLTTNCIGRVMKSVVDAVPENYDYMQDLFDLGEIMEPLRSKLANAIFLAKMEANREKMERHRENYDMVSRLFGG